VISWVNRRIKASYPLLGHETLSFLYKRGRNSLTLKVCKALISDPEIIVQKAISWALRELVPWDRSAVETFLDQHDENIAALVKREVMKKLVTGKKN